jgi:magnesium-transporting ATPase (P-type)
MECKKIKTVIRKSVQEYILNQEINNKVIKMIKLMISLFMFIFIINNVQAELYHEPNPPEYADSDFMKPEAMIMLEQLEIFQLIVITSMLFVNSLKVFGTFLAVRFTNPETKFNPAFAVASLLGVFVGYAAFMSTNPAMDATYVDIFMQAGFYALGANLMFDFAGKVKGKLS